MASTYVAHNSYSASLFLPVIYIVVGLIINVKQFKFKSLIACRSTSRADVKRELQHIPPHEVARWKAKGTLFSASVDPSHTYGTSLIWVSSFDGASQRTLNFCNLPLFIVCFIKRVDSTFCHHSVNTLNRQQKGVQSAGLYSRYTSVPSLARIQINQIMIKPWTETKKHWLVRFSCISVMTRPHSLSTRR